MMVLNLQKIFPATTELLPDTLLRTTAESIPQQIAASPELRSKCPIIADLAAVELALYQARSISQELPAQPTELTVHPGMQLLEVDWAGIPAYLRDRNTAPQRRKGFVIIVPGQGDKDTRIWDADGHDLLALKIVAEKLDPTEIASKEHVSIGHIERILWSAVDSGLLLAPASKLKRNLPGQQDSKGGAVTAGGVTVFTLQWHLTQRCDLHCRHCYDRSASREISRQEGYHVLDQLYHFCKEHNVRAHVTFTGGNPVLAPHFHLLYREAAARGFTIAILGNPISRSELATILQYQMVEFFQVSLEGLADHNDYIRGQGHFSRTIDFLEILKQAGVYSMVMLTLTRDNMDQVLPLAEILRDKVDLFTFNRLAPTGEGALLDPVPPSSYQSFLRKYLNQARSSPHLSLKDNLFNILLDKDNKKLTGGCTGFGCGAAFNFLSLLPDGTVHACRKMDSPIGNLYQDRLLSIYHSQQARAYRRGCSGCLDCPIRANCGGCLAVAKGMGKAIFTDVDPYCFRRAL